MGDDGWEQINRGWEQARSRWYKMDTSWKESILLKMAYIKIRLDYVSIIFGDRCMSGLCMEHNVTMVQADREHVW